MLSKLLNNCILLVEHCQETRIIARQLHHFAADNDDWLRMITKKKDVHDIEVYAQRTQELIGDYALRRKRINTCRETLCKTEVWYIQEGLVKLSASNEPAVQSLNLTHGTAWTVFAGDLRLTPSRDLVMIRRPLRLLTDTHCAVEKETSKQQQQQSFAELLQNWIRNAADLKVKKLSTQLDAASRWCSTHNMGEFVCTEEEPPMAPSLLYSVKMGVDFPDEVDEIRGVFVAERQHGHPRMTWVMRDEAWNAMQDENHWLTGFELALMQFYEFSCWRGSVQKRVMLIREDLFARLESKKCDLLRWDGSRAEGKPETLLQYFERSGNIFEKEWLIFLGNYRARSTGRDSRAQGTHWSIIIVYGANRVLHGNQTKQSGIWFLDTLGRSQRMRVNRETVAPAIYVTLNALAAAAMSAPTYSAFNAETLPVRFNATLFPQNGGHVCGYTVLCVMEQFGAYLDGREDGEDVPVLEDIVDEEQLASALKETLTPESCSNGVTPEMYYRRRMLASLEEMFDNQRGVMHAAAQMSLEKHGENA